MDTHLIALNPHQMAQANVALTDWCEKKLTEVQSELTQAHTLMETLRKATMTDATVRRMVTTIRKRLTFYEKIKAALADGYYILPPIPHQTFAIRSERNLPLKNQEIGSRWHDGEVKAQALPIGDGEYRNAIAEREVVDTVDEQKDGKLVTKNIWENVAWKDIEFPFFPVKPEIVEATGKALQAKIFDWLGAAPQYRSADPMVIGCIKHYKQYAQPIHFFVAWWLDVDTL